MIDVPSVLLGGALVLIGVLAAALADRIRSVVGSREQRSRRSLGISERPTRTPLSKGQAGNDASENEVIAALVAAGYRKRVAVAATAHCAQAERMTVDAWLRAALRRCAKEGAS